jgi:Protein of Unknown function (DUF2784)
MKAPELDSAAVSLVLIAHLLWILWVIVGAFWTRNRPLLAWFHIASLVWGIVAELGPWACPLTLAEEFLEAKSGIDPDRGGFIARYVDAIVYPDLPEVLLVWFGVVVCTVNLAIYGRRYFSKITA